MELNVDCTGHCGFVDCITIGDRKISSDELEQLLTILSKKFELLRFFTLLIYCHCFDIWHIVDVVTWSAGRYQNNLCLVLI